MRVGNHHNRRYGYQSLLCTLPVDEPSVDECGKCTACITSCPTGAIIDDGIVDARKCIS
ncbi:4Fe-4S double cluster binding domain-containing protein, partial [Streptococcus suis]